MVASRARFEVHKDREEASLYRSNLLKRVREIALDDELESAERQMLHAEIGALDERTVVHSTWRYEGAAVLAWALGRLDLPPVYEPVSDRAVGGVFFDMSYDSDSFTLRDSETIESFEELMYNLHWRVRDFSIRPRPYDLRRMFSDVPSLTGVAPVRFLDDDLAIGDVPIFRAPRDRFITCHSVVSERRHAASWLCGHHEQYSEVPLDT